MTEWQEKRLADFVQINPIEKIKKGGIYKKISMEHIQPFCRDITGYEYSTFNGGSKFRNHDTVMARITPCLENGKCAQINVLNDNELGFGSTEFIVFRAITNVSDANFVYYLICSDVIRESAIKSMVGTSGRQRVQTNVLENLILSLPPLDVQKKIAGVLGALDDKIELNNKINQNLEAQAQALFKSWFIDFEPFGGKMPNDWIEKSLEQFCKIFTGRKNANEYIPNGINPFFTCAPEPLRIDSYIYDGPAIIIAGNGAYTGRTRFYKGKFDLYQRTYACTLLPGVKQDYIYLLYIIVKSLLQEKIMGGTHGSAIPYIVMNDISKFNFMYNENIFDQLSQVLRQYVEKILTNEKENTYLSELRDTLLPRLMNGEIEV